MIESGVNLSWLPGPTAIECIDPDEEVEDVGAIIVAVFVVLDEPPLLYCANANAGRTRTAAERRVMLTNSISEAFKKVFVGVVW